VALRALQRSAAAQRGGEVAAAADPAGAV